MRLEFTSLHTSHETVKRSALSVCVSLFSRAHFLSGLVYFCPHSLFSLCLLFVFSLFCCVSLSLVSVSFPSAHHFLLFLPFIISLFLYFILSLSHSLSLFLSLVLVLSFILSTPAFVIRFLGHEWVWPCLEKPLTLKGTT